MTASLMQFTGERFVPQLHIPEICYEHWHRYQFANLFCEGRKVLDIASGEGYGSHFLSQNAKAVVGVDISQESVDHASSMYQRENLTYLVGSASNIPIEEDHSFDVVVSFETIEHIDGEQQRTFLAEVKRLLAPKGVFIVSTPNKALYSDVPHYKNEYHIKEFYEAEFREFLGKSFANIVMLGQKVETGSLINRLTDDQNSFRNFLIRHSEAGFHPVEEELRSEYFLAVCSDALLSNIPSSFCTDLSNRLIASRDEHIAGLEHSMNVVSGQKTERNRTIQTLSAQIVEQDRPILELLAQIAERDQPIQTLSAQIAEQDRSIQAILAQITERDRPIEALSVQIADQDRSIQALSAQIAEIKRSKAWKTAMIFRKIRVLLAPPNTYRAHQLSRMKNVVLAPIRKIRRRRISPDDLAMIKSSGYFDEQWYLAQNPDVARAKTDPLLHYLHNGAFEGRDPGPKFSSKCYLSAYADVGNAGVNPLMHYLKCGKDEGRLALPVQSERHDQRVPSVQGAKTTESKRPTPISTALVYDASPEPKAIWCDLVPLNIVVRDHPSKKNIVLNIDDKISECVLEHYVIDNSANRGDSSFMFFALIDTRKMTDGFHRVSLMESKSSRRKNLLFEKIIEVHNAGTFAPNALSAEEKELPSISIVIPTKNAGDEFANTLSALKNQAYNGKVEIIAIDSASTDRTLAIAEEFGAKIIPIDPKDFDHGLTRNQAIAAGSGEIVLLLSQDAVPGNRHFINNFVSSFEDPRIAGVYGRQIPRPESDLITKRDLNGWVTANLTPEVKCIDDRRAYDNLDPFGKLTFCAFDNVCSAIRRKVWEAIPFGKNDFGEDIEWSKKALEGGHKIGYQPRAFVIHSHYRTFDAIRDRTVLCHKKLYRQFGLQTIPSTRLLWKSFIISLCRDAGYILGSETKLTQKLQLLLKAPRLCYANVSGQYEGARAGKCNITKN